MIKTQLLLAVFLVIFAITTMFLTFDNLIFPTFAYLYLAALANLVRVLAPVREVGVS